MQIELTFTNVYTFLIISCGLGFLYGLYNWISVMPVDIDEKLTGDDRQNINEESLKLMKETSENIQSVILLIYNL